MRIKRILYLIAATTLGFLLGTLLHAAIELPLLEYIVEVRGTSPDEFFRGWWRELHAFVGSLFWIVGMACGFVFGKRWWRRIYEDRRQQPWLKTRGNPPSSTS